MKDLASINQVDNRNGWLESVTLQLVPTSHAQLMNTVGLDLVIVARF